MYFMAKYLNSRLNGLKSIYVIPVLRKMYTENFNRNKHLVIEIRRNQNMAFCMVFWGGQGGRGLR
jgi:hypothetical protein